MITASLPHRTGLSFPLRHAYLTLPLSLLLFSLCGGCTSVDLPSMSAADLMAPNFQSMLLPESKRQTMKYQPAAGTTPALGETADGSLSMETYQRIRQAKAEGAVVLQVAGDEAPIRVLPLPESPRSVFVSELLTQTGVMKRFGRVDATLYRPSPESISGIRMDVQFDGDGVVEPASDYALRPGDRLHVRKKASRNSIQGLVDMALKR